MIFVGRGALLKRAATHALTTGHQVDLVVSNDPADAAGAELPYLITTDVNARAEQLTAHCTDGVVWSINNWMIFRAPLLDSGLRIYNIHNGLLPQHRGLPSAAIAYALLHGHTQYGATLHEVDAGVDTGRILAEHPFPISPNARHHQVLLRGIQACHQLFQHTLPAIAAGHPPEQPLPREPLPGAYYGHRSLRALTSYADHPAYERATDLGVAAPFVPELVEALGAAGDVE